MHNAQLNDSYSASSGHSERSEESLTTKKALRVTALCIVNCALCILSFSASAQQSLRSGSWNGYFQLNDSTRMPFQFEVKEHSVEFINASERITATDLTFKDDSLFIQMPWFNSELRMAISKEGLVNGLGGKLTGNFVNHTRVNNSVIPAFASAGKYEPLVNSFELKNFAGTWDAVFTADDPPLNKAVGIFEQTGNHVTGTFLTPTGDYRFLEGYADDNSLWLSAFDGSHLFYFTAAMQDDGTLRGHYYSGSHFHDTWTAFRNDKAMLPDPDSLTYLKPGYEKLSFSFPDLDSNMVSLSDAPFKNKVVVIQIMGSWCPNCLDESAYLVPFYHRNKNRGFEIIALDYERIATLDAAKKNLQRMKQQYGIDYTLLFAGSTDKSAREKTLPQLNSILSFPTTIIIDRKGRVRNIHTGFSGPATGVHYERWKENFERLINKLLNEI